MRYVSTIPTYMNKFDRPLGLLFRDFSLVLVQWCVSFLSWIHFWLDRGVVNWLWFSPLEWFNHPVVLCTSPHMMLFYEDLVVFWLQIYLSFCQEMFKVDLGDNR